MAIAKTNKTKLKSLLSNLDARVCLSLYKIEQIALTNLDGLLGTTAVPPNLTGVLTTLLAATRRDNTAMLLWNWLYLDEFSREELLSQQNLGDNNENANPPPPQKKPFILTHHNWSAFLQPHKIEQEQCCQENAPCGLHHFKTICLESPWPRWSWRRCKASLPCRGD